MKGAIIVLAAVSGEKICGASFALVLIKAAGQPAEIGCAVEFVNAPRRFDDQRDGVAEGENFFIPGIKSGRVLAIVLPGDEAAQAIRVAVMIT